MMAQTALCVLFIISLLIPLIPWNVRSFLIMVAIIGGFLVLQWVDFTAIISTGKARSEGAQFVSFLNDVFFYVFIIGIIYSSFIRILGLFLQSRGWSRAQVLWIDLLVIPFLLYFSLARLQCC